MTDLPIVITSAGVQPRSPAALRALLIANVLATNPGYTANLPGSMIEDFSSTEVAAITLCDSTYIDLINSLTPYAANDFLLIQQGQLVGVQQQSSTNTSVNVVFTGNAPGQVIAKGLVISDGTYQYIIQDGGITGSGLQSLPLFALATVGGIWSVPAGTVTQILTSLPTGYELTVSNPLPGVPASVAQSAASYRAAVLQAYRASAQGMATLLKTLLGGIPGVQPRLVSVRQSTSPAGWEIIVGGGDPYQVAYAIFYALFDVSTLVGSMLDVVGITNANPAVVTTDLTHNFVTGQAVQIAGVNPSNFNGSFTATVISQTSFSIGIDSTGFPSYVGGGIVTPNSRNQPTTIKDYPDTYIIPIVRPPQQTVTMTVTWGTTAENFVSGAAVSQAAAPALVDYINGIYAGQPMNLFELQSVFQAAVASILPPQLLTRMIFAVAIDGIGVSPISGTGIIAGDPESFLFATLSGITIIQG